MVVFFFALDGFEEVGELVLRGCGRRGELREGELGFADAALADEVPGGGGHEGEEGED